MSKLKLTPMPFERDYCGCWVHPTYTETWEKLFGDTECLERDEYELLLKTLGVDLKYLTLDSDPNVSLEEWERMHEEVDLSDWNPEVPEGYFEVGYWFTEDDAVAVFAKEKE